MKEQLAWSVPYTIDTVLVFSLFHNPTSTDSFFYKQLDPSEEAVNGLSLSCQQVIYVSN